MANYVHEWLSINAERPVSRRGQAKLTTRKIAGRPAKSLDGAADYLGVASQTLRNWRSRGVAPPAIKIRGRVWFFVSELDAFIIRTAAVLLILICTALAGLIA